MQHIHGVFKKRIIPKTLNSNYAKTNRFCVPVANALPSWLHTCASFTGEAAVPLPRMPHILGTSCYVIFTSWKDFFLDLFRIKGSRS